MNFITSILLASWDILLQASIYIFFGILAGGFLKVFLSPAFVARHLNSGRFGSVFKAALMGIPIPLCSCGVLPAAAALKKQGANNGATIAFLVSTPESGVDSISITYALLDPIMTVARPIAAFITAFIAGASENLITPPGKHWLNPDSSCPVDSCCSGENCDPKDHALHHTFTEKIRAGMRYAFGELWNDIAVWFLAGILLAGLITVLVPEDLISGYLGGGLSSMLLMLAFGIPLYICATASTPVAAALILKGVSPGVALVFLLVGPATNMASLSVLIGLLGKRATVLYLATISIVSIICGVVLDAVYETMGISAQATIGQAKEIIPYNLQIAGAVVILALSIKPLYRSIKGRFSFKKRHGHHGAGSGSGCGCSGSCKN